VPVRPAHGSSDQTLVRDLRASVAAYERELLEAALTAQRHNQRATAARLGLTYDQLRHLLRKHDLPAGRPPPADDRSGASSRKAG
jgi:psp operon transcriptional activator